MRWQQANQAVSSPLVAPLLLLHGVNLRPSRGILGYIYTVYNFITQFRVSHLVSVHLDWEDPLKGGVRMHTRTVASWDVHITQPARQVEPHSEKKRQLTAHHDVLLLHQTKNITGRTRGPNDLPGVSSPDLFHICIDCVYVGQQQY